MTEPTKEQSAPPRSSLLPALQSALGWLENKALYLCLVCMTFLVILLMLARFFEIAVPWAQEAAQYFLVYFAFIGAAYAARHRTHMSVLFFLNLFSRGVRRVLYLCGRFLFLAFSVALCVISWRFLMFNAMMGRTTSTLPVDIPFEYVLVSLPMSFLLMGLHELIHIISDIRKSDLP